MRVGVCVWRRSGESERQIRSSSPSPRWYIRYKFTMWWSTLVRGTMTDSRRSTTAVLRRCALLLILVPELGLVVLVRVGNGTGPRLLLLLKLACDGLWSLPCWLRLELVCGGTRPGPGRGGGLAAVGHGLSKIDGSEEGRVRDEHRPDPRGAREHHEITHPPENHLQSRRRRISIGP